jgi:hypothetical protein
MKPGDKIRVLRVPPPVEQETPEEVLLLFRRCVGQVLRIEAIDEHGHLELYVREDGTQAPDCLHHMIWIEPEHVEPVS